jgi:hypothetical protein
MLHGEGTEQEWMTEEFEKDRCKAMEDRDKFTSTELTDLGVSFPKGAGRTNDDTYERKQNPFPLKKKKKFDIREVKPTHS